MSAVMRALVPGDYPTTESLYDVLMLASQIYGELKTRVLELDDTRLSALEQVQAQLDALHQQVGELEGRADQLATPLRKEQAAVSVWVERFDSDLHVQYTTLFRDPRGGYLCLKPQEMVDHVTKVRSFRILKSLSLGIPGNNMVVERLRWGERSGFRFVEVSTVAETDRRANIASAFDGSPDTMFEWERNVIPRRQRLKHVDGLQWVPAEDGREMDVWQATEGMGWEVITVYPEQEVVDPEQRERLADFADEPGEPARVVFEMELEEGATGLLNILTTASGGLMPVLYLLQGSRDGVQWEDLLTPPGRERLTIRLSNDARLDTQITVFVDEFRWLRIGLRAGGWYQPRMGLAHPCAIAVIDEHFEQSALFGMIKLKQEQRVLKRRVETEAYVIGSLYVENLGAKLAVAIPASLALTAKGVTMGWLTKAIGAQAVQWLGPMAVPAAFLVGVAVTSGLFREGKTRQLREVVQGYDVFRGWRSAVAIREIQFLRARYATSGEWVSAPVRFGSPVRRLQLYADQTKPNGTAITYYLSTDMDRWQEVTPVQEGGTVIELREPTDRVYLKIAMSTNNDSVSPMVYSVAVEAFP